MDPNMLKFLEEDEDETMHSGADVEAFTAELNRDIEGNSSTSQKPSDSGRTLSQGSSHTPRQFLHQWQTFGHDENANSRLKIQKDGKDEDTPVHNQDLKQELNPERESQMHKLQNTSNQQQITSNNQQSKLNKQVPFGMLLPIIQPQLDKDRAMQLHTLYFKLKKNEISKDDFVRHMRSIVGDQMLKMSVYKLQMQAAKNSESTNTASSTSLQPQPHDTQMRQAPPNQNPTFNHLGPTNVSQFDRPSFGDPKRTQAHINSNAALQQNPAQWPGKELKNGVPSSMNYAKQEPIDQSNEVQFKDQLFSKPSNAPPKKPLIGQKKPIEGSSPPSSSKKQKVSGTFLDQSIEQLNDVTAVSGVNLREEEEQLFSGPKENSRVSEASRRVVQEEEERLILNKIPLQKKVVEIMAKCGLKNMSNDVERCLSLVRMRATMVLRCVEERMRGLVSNLIKLSKQRVDIEKPRHRTITTSDVRQEIRTINRKAREEWEKKEAETEKSQKLNESETNSGGDGDKEKDESRVRSAKVNKEEDDKMRTTAANVAVRAATGTGDMLSRWQLMIEAKQKQGGTDTLLPVKEVAQKPLSTSTRNKRENQESEKRDQSAAFSNTASVRKVGRNQSVPRVARSISVKDVIAVLEREPQMSKSTLIYRLYDKVRADAVAE